MRGGSAETTSPACRSAKLRVSLATEPVTFGPLSRFGDVATVTDSQVIDPPITPLSYGFSNLIALLSRLLDPTVPITRALTYLIDR